MQKLIHPNIKPLGGYRFKDPDTGFDYNLKYRTFEELEQHVIRYRAQNSLGRIDNFRTVWEAYVCANTPGMRAKCCDVAENVKRSFEQYWSGAKAFIRSVIKGEEAFVEPDVAEERAKKCIDCNQNVRNIGHHHAQFYSDGFIRRQVGSRKTSVDDKLFTCKVCTCILKGKVHYNNEIVAEALSETELGRLMREPRSNSTGKRLNCWQLRAAMDKEDNG